IKYELEKAVYLAKSGRPGPVLVDIPDNLQREEIDPKKIPSFIPKKETFNRKKLEVDVDETIKLIKAANRPVIVFGHGVNLSKSRDRAREFAELLGFPILLTWATMDLFPYDYPLLVGGFGLTASRFGNFTIQNSDLILSIGSRLDTHATGIPKDFGRAAKKVIVDIDVDELSKFKKWERKVDILINADAKNFLEIICEKIKSTQTNNLSDWFKKIKHWKEKYPLCLPEYYEQKNKVNAYVFLRKLSKELKEGEIIVVDTGESLPQTMNTLEIKKGQKIFSAFNNTPMGYSLPASIGACFANNLKRVICISGDGGLQMNIQELATIAKHKLPIKIFIFRNKGYNMIKNTQNEWLNSDYQASSEEKGLPAPDFVKIAKAYGIKAQTVRNNNEIEEKIKEALESKEAFLCSLEIEPKPNFLTTKFGRPIEDISPLLNREEFIDNMIISY
ncbi:MAG: thiamine pyrophosphate-binding protein, partial [Parcubacteria group bacterium]|nr:thiamine pyrophosphate-binding protein [Parcubacteria group bacterium]